MCNSPRKSGPNDWRSPDDYRMTRKDVRMPSVSGATIGFIGLVGSNVDGNRPVDCSTEIKPCTTRIFHSPLSSL